MLAEAEARLAEEKAAKAKEEAKAREAEAARQAALQREAVEKQKAQQAAKLAEERLAKETALRENELKAKAAREKELADISAREQRQRELQQAAQRDREQKEKEQRDKEAREKAAQEAAQRLRDQQAQDVAAKAALATQPTAAATGDSALSARLGVLEDKQRALQMAQDQRRADGEELRHRLESAGHIAHPSLAGTATASSLPVPRHHVCVLYDTFVLLNQLLSVIHISFKYQLVLLFSHSSSQSSQAGPSASAPVSNPFSSPASSAATAAASPGTLSAEAQRIKELEQQIRAQQELRKQQEVSPPSTFFNFNLYVHRSLNLHDFDASVVYGVRQCSHRRSDGAHLKNRFDSKMRA